MGDKMLYVLKNYVPKVLVHAPYLISLHNASQFLPFLQHHKWPAHERNLLIELVVIENLEVN